MNNKCFVIMPYGTKRDHDGKPIDFDVVYESMIKKALDDFEGLECLRCDDIEKPGSIHERMLRHIAEDRVAIVDISTLNPNVFYELGVRHALQRSVTVLISRKGTTRPFNISGMNCMAYSTTPRGLSQGRTSLRSFVSNALRDPNGVDSLVHKTMPNLRVTRVANRLTKVETLRFRLKKAPDKHVGFVTGERADIQIGDIWVNSENTNMQMDHFYGKSTSATLRYLGACKNPTGKIVKDIIGAELTKAMSGDLEVPPATVLVTGPGELKRNKVKWIFHVAAVVGEPREGYRPVRRIDECVKNALRRASERPFRQSKNLSMLFPIFGTGQAGADLAQHAEVCVTAAIEFLETSDSPVRDVYFYVFSDVDLEICKAIASNASGLANKS